VQSVCVFIWNYASGSAMQPATSKFYVHHAVLKCENSTDVIAKGLGMPTKQSP